MSPPYLTLEEIISIARQLASGWLRCNDCQGRLVALSRDNGPGRYGEWDEAAEIIWRLHHNHETINGGLY